VIQINYSDYVYDSNHQQAKFLVSFLCIQDGKMETFEKEYSTKFGYLKVKINIE
jgi:hypothetical protein